MSVSAIMDLAILGVLALCVVMGARKGLFRSLMGLVAVIAALAAAVWASNIAADFVIDRMLRPATETAIGERVDQMLEKGLVEEVRRLAQMGYTRDMVSMQGLGYKEILAYLDGECTLEEAVYVLKRDTRHFAKRQLTWFRREQEVIWVNKPDFDYDDKKILEYILENCKKRGIL